MKVNKINILLSTHANKSRYYFYNEMFDFAKQNKLQGQFGRDYFEIQGLTNKMVEDLEKKKIKFYKVSE